MRGDGKVFRHPKSKFLWVRYSVRGKLFRESTEETEWKRAERFLRHRLSEIGADRLGLKKFVGPKQDKVLVKEILDALEADYRLREVKSLPQVLAHMRPIREAFGHRRAVNVTSESVDRYIESSLAEGKAKATINRGTQVLSQAFRLAVERHLLSGAPKIRRLSEKGNERQGFFEDADFEALVSELPDYLQDFTRFGYFTGWRKSEIASLVWADVDMLERLIQLRGQESKNSEPRKVPLEGELLGVIQRRWQARTFQQSNGTTGTSQYVFHRDGRPIGDYRKAWASASKRASLEGKLYHDFRRTRARNMRRAGVSEEVCMELLGHKTTSMFHRYNITDERDIREAMRKTQEYLDAVRSERTIVPFQKSATEVSK